MEKSPNFWNHKTCMDTPPFSMLQKFHRRSSKRPSVSVSESWVKKQTIKTTAVTSQEFFLFFYLCPFVVYILYTSWSRWKWEGEFVGSVSLSFTHLADRSALPSYSHPATCHRKLPLQPYRTRLLRTTNLLLAFSAWREGGVQLFVWEKGPWKHPFCFQGGPLWKKVYRVPQKGSSKGPKSRRWPSYLNYLA